MTTSKAKNRRRFSDDLKRKLCQDQDYRCMYCGRKRAFSDLEIDHKTPVQRGGSDNLRNLQVLCPPCNKRKGNQTDQEFRRRYRELLPRRQEPPSPAIRQDAFDMVTATTDRPRSARPSQAARSASKKPAPVESLTIRRETGFFVDAFKLTWSSPDSDELIIGYRLQYRTVSGAPDAGWVDFNNPHQGNAPRYEVGSVPQSQRFAFRIQARNSTGWGQWSRTFSEIEPEVKVDEVESSRAQSGKTQKTRKVEAQGNVPGVINSASFERVSGMFSDAVIVRWETPDSPSGLVTAYQIQYRMHQGQTARDWTDYKPPHDGRNPEYRLNNVPKPNVNQFSIRLRAKNDAGWGPWSEELQDSSS